MSIKLSNPKAAAGLVVLAVSALMFWRFWPQLVAKEQSDLLNHTLASSSERRAGVGLLATEVRRESGQPEAGKTYPPRPTSRGSVSNTSWLSMQGDANLRTRIGQALVSNNQEEAAAALNALLYCNKIASSRVDSPTATAEAEMLVRFPGDEKILRRSSVQRRYAQIEDARKSCRYGDTSL